MQTELVAGERLFPHSPMTAEETKVFTTWQSWATEEFADPHRARMAGDAGAVSSCVGLPEADLVVAARAGATIGSARSAALRSTNLDEMFENLVAFGWRPVGVPADKQGQEESLARVRATATVHRKVVTPYRRRPKVAAGPMRRPRAAIRWLISLPGSLLVAQRIRRAGYGWLDDEDGWLVITPTEAIFTGDRRHHLRVAVGDLTEIRETSDLAMSGAIPEAQLRVAHPSLILALARSLTSTSARRSA